MARTLALFFLVLLALAGCQQTPSVGGARRSKYIRSVVSLSPSTTEILAGQFSGVKLLGRTQSCDYPDYIQKSVPVMGGVKPDYEAIAKARPDMIIYDETLYNASDIERLKQLKIELYPFQAKTLDGFIDELFKLGSKLAGETEVSDYVDRIITAKTGNQSDSTIKRKVMLVLGGEGGEYMVAGLGSIQADFLRACGFEPIGPEGDRFMTVNVEKMIADQPEAIVVAGDATRIMNDPRLKSMKAIQAKHVAAISDQNLILRAGGRVDMLLGNLRPAVEGLFTGTN